CLFLPRRGIGGNSFSSVTCSIRLPKPDGNVISCWPSMRITVWPAEALVSATAGLSAGARRRCRTRGLVLPTHQLHRKDALQAADARRQAQRIAHVIDLEVVALAPALQLR